MQRRFRGAKSGRTGRIRRQERESTRELDVLQRRNAALQLELLRGRQALEEANKELDSFSNSIRMSQLIDGLLTFSRLGRKPLTST